MPGLSANQVVLSEVLEVRGGPLYEDELWAVLYESCDSVKDMFLRGLYLIFFKVVYHGLCASTWGHHGVLFNW